MITTTKTQEKSADIIFNVWAYYTETLHTHTQHTQFFSMILRWNDESSNYKWSYHESYIGCAITRIIFFEYIFRVCVLLVSPCIFPLICFKHIFFVACYLACSACQTDKQHSCTEYDRLHYVYAMAKPLKCILFCGHFSLSNQSTLHTRISEGRWRYYLNDCEPKKKWFELRNHVYCVQNVQIHLFHP